ncbi:methylaspartate mutase subunit E [Natranaerofaba carboxydovora]|uniref:methylaspartate mutase subunit E n=1 Tax=Natranaerofaba carboxydovora TaxID=2742683 RepID=UPI001F13D368|nr:methylaspartate mutase subunit E [Natranaerofaba carboxydovora]UMZ72824.1 Glutamate mutase epsilon subunit [Natranaerofaba carboxydovora]
MRSIRNKADGFLKEREKVLKEWETGQEVNLKEAANYHKNLPDNKKANYTLMKSKEEDEILLQCLGSYASFQRQLAFYKKLQEEGNADILTVNVDSFTQNKDHQRAKHDYENELSHDRILLDGFPLVVHGIIGCRRLIENNEVPIQVRHEGTDVRLMAEISFAAGLTDFLGGGICNTVFDPQAKSIEENINNWNYVDSLVALYEENNVRINREIFVPLTGTLIPPSLQLVLIILDGLISAQNGARSITLCYNQGGNMVQDAAALLEMENLFFEYLKKIGFDKLDNFEITTSFYQWPGGFPDDEAKSFGIIVLGAMVASFANATKLVVKTPNEAVRMPDEESYVKGLKAARHTHSLSKYQVDILPSEKIEEEREIIRNSTRSILNAVLSNFEEEIDLDITGAFEKGVLDLPFSSFGKNLGLVMPVRDDKGAVRYFDSGKLPLPDSIKKYNKEQIIKRANKENREPCFQMVIDDIYAAGKGLIYWDND